MAKKTVKKKASKKEPRKKPGPDGTLKQSLFVKHYLATKNATKAALLAGYSKKSADTIGSQLLRKTQIRAMIKEEIDEAFEILKMDKLKTFREIDAIANSKVTDFMSVERATIEVADKYTGEVQQVSKLCTVVLPTSEWPEELKGAVSEILTNADGTLRLKMHDKKAMLLKLAEIQEIGQPEAKTQGGPVNVYANLSPEELLALTKAARGDK